jgi:prolyl 4-hydroxylase
MKSSSQDPISETKEYLESRNISHLFPESDWEFKMVSECRSKLAIKPVKLQAILFYSQHPNGMVDRLSRHGGCPVISGQKWAANLWVWNGPRSGYSKKSKGHNNSAANNVKASFESLDVEGAKLYWENKFWSDLTPNNKISVNTFIGHIWNVKLKEEIIATYVIEKDKLSQSFVLTSSNLNEL